MKKFLKWAVIVICCFILIGVGLSIFLKTFLSSDRLKSIILPKAESMTGRKVNLEEIRVSLWKGVVAKGLSVKEKDGKTDFVKIGEFVLSYQLLPLLKKQFIISKMEVLSPSISVKRYKSGRYNFSDLSEKGPTTPTKHSESVSRGLPLSITTDKIFIRNAHFAFVDETQTLPDISADLDVELKGSIGKDGTPQMENAQISLKEIKTITGDIIIKTSGKVFVEPKAIQATLQALIGKERIEITANVKNYLSSPDLQGNIHAKFLDLEKLIAMGGIDKIPEKRTPEKIQGVDQRKESVLQKDPKTVKSSESSLQKVKASGRITIDEAKYEDYRLKDLHLDYHYVSGLLKLDLLGVKFSGGDAFTAEGTLNGNLQMVVDGLSSIQKSLRGKGEVKLGKGRIKESKMFGAIANLLGISELKQPEIEEGLLNFDIRDEKINLDGFIQSSLFKLAPKGTVDFEKRLDLLPGLKISPSLTGKLGKSLAMIKFMEDEQGWKNIPIKIKGTLDQPKTILDEEALKKQLVPGLKRKIGEFLERRAPERDSSQSREISPKDLLKDLFGK